MGIKKVVVRMCLLCLMCLVLCGCETVPEQRGIVSNSQERSHKPAPIPAPQSLQYGVKRALGSSNRGIAKVSNIQVIGKNIQVYFTVNDNLTKGMVKSSAKINIVDILKAVQSSGYDYSEVTIFGTFSLTDKFGNSEESMVVQATYTRSTINRINWKNFLYDDVYDIADSVRLHPAFR